ncbi:AraC family transcriptional regulator [Vibrio nigripulchritudo]|uniref:AraC family transcriptional regulator n=1 Tax=Vibrio nigripulchritudo TaxID=28173 RepID=UPI002493A6CE|nr:effector binding domain-containing protein [Vibrio nigripulchritudo]BDU40856.1 AraC family transcriptional regulator [Vibrio nigripulchritudo]BDU46593.1 AraC family transcriptional regulator [Vibrio nigripulchritudo]
MRYIERIEAGIAFVEAHLSSRFELHEVAKAAGMSQWHFQRIFKALTGETLKTYIRNRRLSQSLAALESDHHRIIDIALDAGYESQEAYTRAFKSLFGINPNQYRHVEHKKQWLKKNEITADYLKQLARNSDTLPEFYHQPELWLAGLHTRFHSSDSDKNNIADKLPALWNDFLPRIQELGNLTDSSTAYGVVQPVHDNTDLLEYYAAVQVEPDTPLPDGFSLVRIPSARYAKFAHRGYPQALDESVNYIYSNWLLNQNCVHTLGPDLEIYGPEYKENSEASCIHYAIPITP